MVQASILLIALMLFALVGAGLLIVREARQAFTAELEQQIDDSVAVLDEAYQQGGRDGLVATVADLTANRAVSQHVAGVFTLDGKPLAGQFTAVPVLEGWDRVELANTATRAPETYHVRMLVLPDVLLVVGRSTRLVDRTIGQMQIVLPVLGLFLVVGIAGAGVIVHGALAGELTRLEAALRRFAAGLMDERIALDGLPRDKIEDIAALVNAHLDQLQTSILTSERTAAAIAHDLRTPLTRASLQIQAIGGRGDIPLDAAAALTEATAELERLSAMCDAILRISTIDASVSRAAFTAFDLADLADEVAETYAPVFEDAERRLDYAPPDGAVPVVADRRMIGQVLVNLLTNVIAHCPTGTVARVRVTQEDGAACLVVSDNGPGVPAQERDAIFEPFHRLDPSRSATGSGLGLSLVRAAARHHGATLTTSDARPGLMIRMKFPALA